jgi:hypothetical protein
MSLGNRSAHGHKLFNRRQEDLIILAMNQLNYLSQDTLYLNLCTTTTLPHRSKSIESESILNAGVKLAARVDPERLVVESDWTPHGTARRI